MIGNRHRHHHHEAARLGAGRYHVPAALAKKVAAKASGLRPAENQSMIVGGLEGQRQEREHAAPDAGRVDGEEEPVTE